MAKKLITPSKDNHLKTKPLHRNLSNKDKRINWEKENKEAIDEYNRCVEKVGLILQHRRMF
ncbi:MAG: type II toxin-antitoxin system CcdA family antitoxin [Arcobacter sp.]|uniref:type II toxin-antitoxin system CcdA family antitoxin n=1 Tax=Arcobacter sp. TaxID=1872629 RepID=UPI003AFF6FAB